MVVHPLENLLHSGRHGYGGTDGVSTVESVVEIFDVQVDFEAGLVVPCDHHGSFGIHDRGAGEAALDCVKDKIGIHARLLGKGQCLSQSLDIAGYNNLICKFRGVACANISAKHHRGAHCAEHIFELVKGLLLASDHDRQSAVDSLRLAARDRRIQHLDTILCNGLAQLLGGDRVDGAHVDKGGAGLHVGGNTVVTQHNRLDLRTVGEHGDDYIAALCNFNVASGLGADSNNRVALGHVAVGDSHIIASLDEVDSHGFAHNAHSDESDFHNFFPFISHYYKGIL